jgi:acetyl-CoA carboxylase carboxyl transferase subunit alpha
MQQFTIYSVIPPEGCAASLWRDSKKKVEAAEALKITAPDLLQMGLIDEIVKEPVGGAHSDYEQATALVDEALSRHLAELQKLDGATRLDRRYAKFRAMGRLGQAFKDVTPEREPDLGQAERASIESTGDISDPRNPGA